MINYKDKYIKYKIKYKIKYLNNQDFMLNGGGNTNVSSRSVDDIQKTLEIRQLKFRILQAERSSDQISIERLKHKLSKLESSQEKKSRCGRKRHLCLHLSMDY
jgi:hypothetical protein